jgi:hypothetical protein
LLRDFKKLRPAGENFRPISPIAGAARQPAASAKPPGGNAAAFDGEAEFG